MDCWSQPGCIRQYNTFIWQGRLLKLIPLCHSYNVSWPTSRIGHQAEKSPNSVNQAFSFRKNSAGKSTVPFQKWYYLVAMPKPKFQNRKNRLPGRDCLLLISASFPKALRGNNHYFQSLKLSPIRKEFNVVRSSHTKSWLTGKMARWSVSVTCQFVAVRTSKLLSLLLSPSQDGHSLWQLWGRKYGINIHCCCCCC